MAESVQSSPVLTPFGKYLLDEEIARGGMARVYLARLRGLGGFEKRLVVKQVLPELASDPRFVSMFVEEAKTLVRMSHPNIVPVYELGIVDGIYFLAMEHVEGATLAEMLAEGTMEPTIVAHAGVQVCDALQYAHQRFGLVHRDVTPRNVIVDANGHARLLDFGIAARADGTGTGEVFGSPGYMSPEQALGEPVTPQSDIFSLGLVLLEAVTGTPVYLRDTATETRMALLKNDRATVPAGREVPPGLTAILEETLAMAPAERPCSAIKLGQQLRQWLAVARPEGVAPELGARAEAARKARANRPATVPPPSQGRRDPSGVVRSIATSVTLLALLGEQDGAMADNGDATEEPGRDSLAGTVPIAGRSPRPPDEEQVGTVPVPRRAEATAADERIDPDPGTGAPAASSGRTFRLSPLHLVVAVLAGIAIAVGASGLWTGEPADPASTGETGDRDPRTELPTGPLRPADPEGGDPRVPPLGPDPAQHTSAQTPGETEPRAPAPAQGILTINSRPWSSVTVDGRPLGNTPVRSAHITAGAHVLVLESDALGRRARVSVRVTAGSHVSVLADLYSDPPRVSVQ